MPPYRFAFWNLVGSLGWAVPVAASAYGVGRLASGHHSGHDIAILIMGLGAPGSVPSGQHLGRHVRAAIPR